MNATELRAIRGAMTRKEFASLLGWKAGTLANYENGNPIPGDRAAHVRLWVRHRKLIALLKECESVINAHHSMAIIHIKGNCPVCVETGSIAGQDNIFYRIKEALKEGEI